MNIIPAIDLKNGRCVRLFKGDFDQATEYGDDPAAMARQFAALDVAELHVVDLDGARTGTQAHAEVIGRIAGESRLTVQVGGGIRDEDTLRLWFDTGVARVVIGSLAVTDTARVLDWIDRFGAERIVLALDVSIDEKGSPVLTTHGWTRSSGIGLRDCLDRYAAAGLRHLLCTDVGRDGALTGPNVDLYRTILAAYPAVRLQASGGVRDIGDLTRLRDCGVPAAITGRALLDGRISAQEIRSFRQGA